MKAPPTHGERKEALAEGKSS